jgi:hypothetical protein
VLLPWGSIREIVYCIEQKPVYPKRRLAIQFKHLIGIKGLAMQTPVGEHIRKLEERLQVLNVQAMQNSRSLPERNEIEAEIRAVNLVLAHYKAALELEKQLSTKPTITRPHE